MANLYDPPEAVLQQALPRSAPLLSVEGLQVEFSTARGVVRAVDGVSWDVAAGEFVALVGESGCGKSVTALSILRLLAPSARIVGGRVLFEGTDLLSLGDDQMRALRGRDIAMVFQEPMTSLNPVLTIGLQIAEPLRQHLGMSAEQARARSLELLREVGISDAEQRLDQHPHQLSGGMRQRVMIAIGLACGPRLLIADEPTTALDVTIQAQILELMKDLARRKGIAVVLITHNLGIVARHADRVNVMYAGRIVESGTVDAVFEAPRHPYTRGLLAAVPRLDRPRERLLATVAGMPPDLLQPPLGCRFAPRCEFSAEVCKAVSPDLQPADGREVACHRVAAVAAAGVPMTHTAPAADAAQRADDGTPLLQVHALSKHFSQSGATVRAVQDVSFTVRAGETVGLVGESGCGKTTVGRMVLGLAPPTAGEVRFRGQPLPRGGAALRALRRQVQVVFQDPYGSLNPRMTVGDTLVEPLAVHRIVPRERIAGRVAELLQSVGLDASFASRYAHQLSGGQRQRVSIARALAMEPSFIVLDEPVSALDVCVQGQIVNLLSDLQQRLGVAYLFVGHDLAVVRHLAHRLVVMYLGRVMETAERDVLYAEPLHPYTIALLNAAPIPDPRRERATPRPPLAGELPSPSRPPAGCVFHTRCPRASRECTEQVPALREVRPGRFAACIKV